MRLVEGVQPKIVENEQLKTIDEKKALNEGKVSEEATEVSKK